MKIQLHLFLFNVTCPTEIMIVCLEHSQSMIFFSSIIHKHKINVDDFLSPKNKLHEKYCSVSAFFLYFAIVHHSRVECLWGRKRRRKILSGNIHSVFYFFSIFNLINNFSLSSPIVTSKIC